MDASYLSSRTRVRPVKKGFDPEGTRQQRDDTTIELRKVQRHEALQKRRQRAPGVSAVPDPEQDDEKVRKPRFSADVLEALRNLDDIVKGVFSDESARQLECVTKLRKLLSLERHAPIAEVVRTGVVPRVVQFLHPGVSTNLQFMKVH
jgi:importin subunit alpha-6/7